MVVIIAAGAGGAGGGGIRAGVGIGDASGDSARVAGGGDGVQSLFHPNHISDKEKDHRDYGVTEQQVQ